MTTGRSTCSGTANATKAWASASRRCATFFIPASLRTWNRLWTNGSHGWSASWSTRPWRWTACAGTKPCSRKSTDTWVAIKSGSCLHYASSRAARFTTCFWTSA
jgi:hypothetical protein